MGFQDFETEQARSARIHQGWVYIDEHSSNKLFAEDSTLRSKFGIFIVRI